MPYVTYDFLIQFAVFVVTLVGLVVKICHKDKKITALVW